MSTMSNPKTKEYAKKHSVVMVILKDGKILLEERTVAGTSYFGFTIVPGGAVKRGETLEQAMIREVVEERAVTPIVYRQIGKVERVEENRTSNVMYVFLITDYLGKLINNERKNRPFWATLSRAEKVCKHPMSKEILTLVRKALNEEELLKGL